MLIVMQDQAKPQQENMEALLETKLKEIPVVLGHIVGNFNDIHDRLRSMHENTQLFLREFDRREAEYRARTYHSEPSRPYQQGP